MASLCIALLLASVSLVSTHTHDCADAGVECIVLDEISVLQTGTKQKTSYTDSSGDNLHRTKPKGQMLPDEALALKVKSWELHKAAHAGSAGLIQVAALRNTCMDHDASCHECPVVLTDPGVVRGYSGFDHGERNIRPSFDSPGYRNGEIYGFFWIDVTDVQGFRPEIGALRIRYMKDESKNRDEDSRLIFTLFLKPATEIEAMSGQHGMETAMTVYNDANYPSCVRPAICTVDLTLHPDADVIRIESYTHDDQQHRSIEVVDMSLMYGNCQGEARGGVLPNIRVEWDG